MEPLGRNVEKTAEEITLHQQDADLSDLLDQLAYENALLIFLADRRQPLSEPSPGLRRVFGKTGEKQRYCGLSDRG